MWRTKLVGIVGCDKPQNGRSFRSADFSSQDGVINTSGVEFQTMTKGPYTKPSRLADVLALIQVLAFDPHAHRSESGINEELGQPDSSAQGWTALAKELLASVFGAGFVLGTIRTLWLVPRVGTRIAELLESPIMLVVITSTAPWGCSEFQRTSVAVYPRWYRMPCAVASHKCKNSC
jgi:hypothetical protein